MFNIDVTKPYIDYRQSSYHKGLSKYMTCSLRIILLTLVCNFFFGWSLGQQLSVSKDKKEPLVTLQNDLVMFILDSKGDLHYISIAEIADIDLKYDIYDRLSAVGGMDISYNLDGKVSRVGVCAGRSGVPKSFRYSSQPSSGR